MGESAANQTAGCQHTATTAAAYLGGEPPLCAAEKCERAQRRSHRNRRQNQDLKGQEEPVRGEQGVGDGMCCCACTHSHWLRCRLSYAPACQAERACDYLEPLPPALTVRNSAVRSWIGRDNGRQRSTPPTTERHSAKPAGRAVPQSQRRVGCRPEAGAGQAGSRAERAADGSLSHASPMQAGMRALCGQTQ